MKFPIPTALLAALLASQAATASPPVADESIFVEGSRYSAVFSPGQRAWRLLPAAGEDIRLRMSPDCRASTALPRGLWLLTRSADGQPQLVAPSSTSLPSGHRGQVRLVDCDRPQADGEPSLAVPAGLVDWLENRSGVIYVVR